MNPSAGCQKISGTLLDGGWGGAGREYIIVIECSLVGRDSQSASRKAGEAASRSGPGLLAASNAAIKSSVQRH